MRADIFLVKTGLCESRNKAKQCIDEGQLYVNGKNFKKASAEVNDEDTVEIRGENMPFVSRGGLKLLGAIKSFGLDFNGLTCVDIGASTGGFTDCLLQNGAKKIYAVDCGVGQLHQKLLNNEKVVSIEKFNARYLTYKTLGEICDAAVMDVSFISQTLLYSAVKNTVKNGGMLVSLIKPQFEAGKEAINRNGIVKDKKVHVGVIKKIIKAAEENGLVIIGLAVSPILGGNGNTEYLACFKIGHTSNLFNTDEFLKNILISEK